MAASPDWFVILLLFFLLTLCSKAHRMSLFLTPGDEFSINCTGSVQDIRSVDLYKEDTRILSYDGTSDYTREAPESGRVIVTGVLRTPRFTLTNISDSDSGIYYCKYNNPRGDSRGRATLLAVSGDVLCIPAHSSAPAAGGQEIFLILATALLVVFVVICAVAVIWLVAKIKCRERKVQSRCSDSVYEEMRMQARGAETSKC